MCCRLLFASSLHTMKSKNLQNHISYIQTFSENWSNLSLWLIEMMRHCTWKNIIMIKIELQLQVEFDPIVFCLPYLAFVPAPFFCVSLPSPHNFLLELFPDLETKVVYPKYSKHWLSTVAHTIDCFYSKILNHGLNHRLLFSLFKILNCLKIQD